jgi:SET domain-containing protein
MPQKYKGKCVLRVVNPMILPSIYIGPTLTRGRGVFTAESIAAGVLIEIAPVIVLSGKDRQLLDQTLLHDYIFEWGQSLEQCCMALGYIPIYNHACPSNCEYEMDFDAQQILIRTVRAVESGEELFINYQGNFDDATPVWFACQ